MIKTAEVDAGFIPRAVALPRSQDYRFLRRRGLSYIQRLAHDLWTDYNVHDPGITILEILCYAITDLGLRASYPMRDLLARSPSGSASSSEPDFHLAHQVLVCRPVSFDDLRRKLIDIPGVRNAWIERHRQIVYRLDVPHERLTDDPTAAQSVELNGLFDVSLEYEDFVTDAGPMFRTRTAVGLPDATGEGEYIATGGKGLEFEAVEDARLESVDLYAEAVGDVVIRLMHRDEEVDRRTLTVSVAQAAVTATLGFTLRAGRVYRLETGGGATRLHRTRRANYPMPAMAGPIRIVRGYATGSTPTAGRNAYYFFYNWQVAHDSAGLTKAEVRAAAIECVHTNRNLCEDVINVCDLAPEDVAICADMELRPDADTDAVHAEILYRLHHHVSPAVPFHSLDEMLARGRSVDEIFEGPLLEHGFIDEDELRAIRRKCEIRASDVVQLLMDIDGVVAIKSLTLLKLSDPEHGEAWILPLSSDQFRIAVFNPWGSKLIFYKRGLPYYTSRAAVEPLFSQKKAADIEAKLKVRRQELAVPSGESRDVGQYEPVQNELPVTYFVGRTRVPASDPVRQAQSRQLKAYLACFEQHLANYLSQLEHVGDLFTWRDVAFRTYFTQQVAGVVDFNDLDCSRQHGFATFLQALDTIIETPAVSEERRLRLLEHLAARVAEEFGEYSALMGAIVRADLATLSAWTSGTAYQVGVRVRDVGAQYECLIAHTSVAGSPPRSLPATWRQVSRLITHKRRFLQDYPALSAGRGTGFDWRWPEVPENISGYQRRVYRLLDIEPVARRRLAGHAFTIVDVGTPAEPAWRFELDDEDGRLLFHSIECESRVAIEALLDAALRFGGDESQYDVRPDSTEVLVHRCEDGDKVVGTIDAAGSRAQVAAYFRQYGESEGFHVIEHILLRRRSVADAFLPVQLDPDDDCCPAVRDPYSFRVSIVFPSWSPRFRDMKFRRFVEDTVRRETPAHIYPRICWVNHEQMKQLEIAAEDWQSQLALRAREPAFCGAADDGTRTGRLPLPPGDPQLDGEYADAHARLVRVMYRLTNVYPLAQLHDCEEVDSDVPQVTLGNTNLGTL